MCILFSFEPHILQIKEEWFPGSQSTFPEQHFHDLRIIVVSCISIRTSWTSQWVIIRSPFGMRKIFEIMIYFQFRTILLCLLFWICSLLLSLNLQLSRSSLTLHSWIVFITFKLVINDFIFWVVLIFGSLICCLWNRRVIFYWCHIASPIIS